MMSLQQIVQMSDDAAKRAKAKGVRPMQIGTYITESEERTARALRQVPHIGSWRPRDLRLVQRGEVNFDQRRLAGLWCDDPYIFVDSSGFGAPGEGALTFSEFIDLVRANPQYSYAIVEAGQFQVVVGVFDKANRKN